MTATSDTAERPPRIGRLPSGPRDSLGDVAGVSVGHCTLDDGDVQTGVTVIRPHACNLYRDRVPAAAVVINGFGKSIGLVQLEELGLIDTPIALTNTLSVPAMASAVGWSELANSNINGKGPNPVGWSEPANSSWTPLWCCTCCVDDPVARRCRLCWPDHAHQTRLFEARAFGRAHQRQPCAPRRTRSMAAALLATLDPRRDRLRAACGHHPLQPGQAWLGCTRGGLAAFINPSLLAPSEDVGVHDVHSNLPG